MSQRINLSEQVYKVCSKIPKGKVTTYKIIGDKLGTRGYRIIGKILSNNPNVPKIPCHRVVKSDGTLGGYKFGIENKKRLLRKESIVVRNNKIVNFNKVLFK